MRKRNVDFKNKNQEDLHGIIYLPNNNKPLAFVLFAHCFTCSKNLKTVKYISESLTQQGFGVMAFDFTGLGESEGDFSDTNFSHNISDLNDASEYLMENYQSPSLLVGHSLGGTACLYVAKEIESVQAVVSIGSPNNPEHVTNLLESSLEEIEEKGESKVDIGGRKFNIKKQFLDDLKERSKSDVIKDLGKSLLIFHSPQDKIVGIKNAEEIYKRAKHPKSFVSLDGASHLLTDEVDAKYVGEVIASWSKRYIKTETPSNEKSDQLKASIAQEDHFTTQLQVRGHHLIADEPKKVDGADLGPTPGELVSAALASCTLMTLKMYAKRKEWKLGDVHIKMDTASEKSGKDKVHQLTRTLHFTNSDLTQEQHEKLLSIANKCPVHRMLTEQKVQVKTEIS